MCASGIIGFIENKLNLVLWLLDKRGRTRCQDVSGCKGHTKRGLHRERIHKRGEKKVIEGWCCCTIWSPVRRYLQTGNEPTGKTIANFPVTIRVNNNRSITLESNIYSPVQWATSTLCVFDLWSILVSITIPIQFRDFIERPTHNLLRSIYIFNVFGYFLKTDGGEILNQNSPIDP